MGRIFAVLGLAVIAAPAYSQSSGSRPDARLDSSVVNGSGMKPYERRFEVYETRELMHGDTTGASERDVGTLDDRLYLAVQNGDTALVRVRHVHVIGAETFDTSVYDRRTLALRTDRWRSDRESQGYDVVGSRVSYFYQRPNPNASHVTSDTTLRAPSFYLEGVDLILQALTLRYDVDRTFRLSVFNYSATAERLELWTLDVRVMAHERLRLTNGEQRDTWVIELSNGDKYWLDAGDRQPLMWRETDEGGVITYRLVGR